VKYSTKTWTRAAGVNRYAAAMRHVVLSPDEEVCYVSDLCHNFIYEIDAVTLRILHSYKVFNNPNTIEITKDGRFLFVSCRGPDNPKSYLLRSPENGRIYVIDTVKKEVVQEIDGGNQPTGLDLSPDDRYLAFSNFRDDSNFELYDVSDITGK